MAGHRAVKRARELRRTMTPPEVKLWAGLRTRPAGFRFRRQHPIGNDLALDFYCPAARLAIEVDGIAHDMGANPEPDARRDAWLRSRGIDTLRISAKDVMQELDTIVRMILNRCAVPLHQPSAGSPPHPADGEDMSA